MLTRALPIAVVALALTALPAAAQAAIPLPGFRRSILRASWRLQDSLSAAFSWCSFFSEFWPIDKETTARVL